MHLEPTSVMVTSQLAGDEVVALILSVAISRAVPFMPLADGTDRRSPRSKLRYPENAPWSGAPTIHAARPLGEPAPRSAQRDGHRTARIS